MRTPQRYGAFDLIFEATGFSPIVFGSMQALAKNGALVLSSGGNRQIQVSSDNFNLELVLGNKVMVGTVNVNRDYFEAGICDMAFAEEAHPGWLAHLLSHRVDGLERYQELFLDPRSRSESIKVFCEVAARKSSRAN